MSLNVLLSLFNEVPTECARDTKAYLWGADVRPNLMTFPIKTHLCYILATTENKAY